MKKQKTTKKIMTKTFKASLQTIWKKTEQDNNNRKPEQIAIKDTLNSSAQDDKDRQDINSENNEGKDNSNKRVSEESEEYLLGRMVKRFKFR